MPARTRSTKNSTAVHRRVLCLPEEGSPRAGGDPNLIVDVLDVVVDGLHRDDELTGDLLFGVTTRDEPQDYHLALGETGHEFPVGPVYRVTGRRSSVA
jgi:hypothetical protein